MSLPASQLLALVLRVGGPCALPRFPGSELRGMLGQGLKLAFCQAAAGDGARAEKCRGCPTRFERRCPYSLLFEPRRNGAQDAPRPIVLRVPVLPSSGEPLSGGDVISFELLAMGEAADQAARYVDGLRLVGRRRWFGRGPRTGFEVAVDASHLEHDGGAQWFSRRLRALAGTERLLLELAGPLALRQAQRVVSWYDLDLFLARAWERLAALHQAFGPAPGAPTVAAPSLPTRGAWVERLRARRIAFPRRGRGGDVLPMEGLVGEVVLAGELGPLLPLLVAAERFHVGRHTSFGFGALRLSALPLGREGPKRP